MVLQKDNKMTPEQIKQETERCYAQIKSSEERLAEIRKICKHEHTEQCTYMVRIGMYIEAVVCSHCGEFVKSVEEGFFGLPQDIINNLTKR